MTQKGEKFRELTDKFLEDLKLLNECFPDDDDSLNILCVGMVDKGDGQSEQKLAIQGKGSNIIASLIAAIDNNPNLAVIMGKAVSIYPNVALIHALSSENPDELDRVKKNVEYIRKNL